jgi:prepilin-type N-terminal cleavage/methylation domain-containing protein
MAGQISRTRSQVPLDRQVDQERFGVARSRTNRMQQTPQSRPGCNPSTIGAGSLTWDVDWRDVSVCYSPCRNDKMRGRKPDSALTLVELLMVVAIISILAGLLLGAVHVAHARIKDKIWRIEAYNFHDYIQQHLFRYYQSQTNYPVLAAEDLRQRGVFDDRIMDFLRCPHVRFIPFSSSDPDDKYILRIDNDWVFQTKPVPGHKNDLVLMKKHVTKPEE